MEPQVNDQTFPDADAQEGSEGGSSPKAEDDVRRVDEELNFQEYVLRDPLLFGDYRNALNDDDDEQRCYEDLLDYEAVYHLLQEVLHHLHVSLFPYHQPT